jgi:hypothetical protein
VAGLVEQQRDLAVALDARDGVDGDRRRLSRLAAVSSSKLMGAPWSDEE